MGKPSMEEIASKVWQNLKGTEVYKQHPNPKALDAFLKGPDGAFVPFKSPLVNFVAGRASASMSNARACPFDFSGMQFHGELQLLIGLPEVAGVLNNDIKDKLIELTNEELARVQTASQDRSL